MLNHRRVLLTSWLILFLLAVPVPAQQDVEEEEMPEGEGRGLVRSVCSTCHSLEQTLAQPKSREGWELTVDDMISRGAQIFPEELEEIVNYLAEHYGTEESQPKESPQPDSPESSESSRRQRLTHPSVGQELLTSKCFQCHGEGMWQDLRQGLRDWVATLYRMVGHGALWTEAEISRMADHLAERNGPR